MVTCIVVCAPEWIRKCKKLKYKNQVVDLFFDKHFISINMRRERSDEWANQSAKRISEQYNVNITKRTTLTFPTLTMGTGAKERN